MSNYDKYIRVEKRRAEGFDLKAACSALRLPVSSYYYYKRKSKAKIALHENDVSFKLLLLYSMLIAESLMLLAFWFKIL